MVSLVTSTTASKILRGPWAFQPPEGWEDSLPSKTFKINTDSEVDSLTEPEELGRNLKISHIKSQELKNGIELHNDGKIDWWYMLILL
jgi:hypothetical protein